MKTQKKNELDKAQQVDQMIDDGLGGGRVVEKSDKKKLKSEQEKKEEKLQREKDNGDEKAQEKRMDVDNSSMASNLEEVEQLGKEMEHMKTNKEVTKDGDKPDPPQKEGKK